MVNKRFIYQGLLQTLVDFACRMELRLYSRIEHKGLILVIRIY